MQFATTAKSVNTKLKDLKSFEILCLHTSEYLFPVNCPLILLGFFFKVVFQNNEIYG